MNKKFKCPLQVAYRKVLDNEEYEDYYNSNCVGCSNNRPPKEKSFEENVHDLDLTFKILPVLTKIDEYKAMSKNELFNKIAKESAMYN